MPIIESTYKPLFWTKSGFVSTVFSGLARKVSNLDQSRERITLPDNDFLDLDWSYSESKSNKVIILLHGLEGHAQRPYLTGAAKLFNQNDIDACAVNFRGCSGEPNLLYRSYHSGATEDLDAVVKHIISLDKYDEIYIKGISLGANMALKYVGEERELPKAVKAVIAISSPCDLKGSCDELLSLKNKAYAIRFLDHLKQKLKPKLKQFPDKITVDDYKSIKTLIDFDHVYTSKAHGFKDAYDYYQKASSLQLLPNIKVPSLLINALNDSFLSPDCYPVKEAKANPNLYFEMPKYGGHVGFIQKGEFYYNEKRALDFVSKL
ncbi:alpha/beta hydrolase [Winogradskyella sp. PC-19]|uniref:YheT family hydrolase n=1 Tax=unclassified Winogradskyella TaxID=2615021 RepID=UPI000B3C11D8|nr:MULTISPECIES: alpha/beta fold hydrolase [unclassified Winogradskyella]ARV08806.1 alpha/beta hydrolase [Winogradskyella sp. PC-19]RZN76853.1 MAG: alpha/beta fold hydrolase [Winogradskyella sp.]